VSHEVPGKHRYMEPLSKNEKRFDNDRRPVPGRLQEKDGQWFIMVTIERYELAYPITLNGTYDDLKPREPAKIDVAEDGDKHDVYITRFDRLFCIGSASNTAAWRQWRFK